MVSVDLMTAAQATEYIDERVSQTGLLLVDCGGDPTAARPAGAAAVYWVNSPTEPVNAENDDLWVGP